MNASFSKNLLTLIIFTFVVVAIVFVWNNLFPAYSNQHIYWVILFFLGMNAFALKIIIGKMNSENKNEFTITFLGFTGMKLFLNLMIIVIYAVVNKPMLFTFAIMLLAIYMLYTFLEVYLLMRLLKKANNK